MNWQRHETPEEKMMRKLKYMELRDAGISAKAAIYYRDWTLNKVRLITEGGATPQYGR